MGKETGWLKAKVEWEEDQLTPPLHGWQYFVGGGKWESDPTMVCSREVLPPCTEVRVDKLARLTLSFGLKN